MTWDELDRLKRDEENKYAVHENKIVLIWGGCTRLPMKTVCSQW